MRDYQRDFLKFSIESGVLRFGDFVLKSGRRSPYFFDTGQFKTGVGLANLGRAYAETIMAAEIEFDMLYGPAYKGIPLVVATSMALAIYHYRQDVPFAFNRKETKDHGEGGSIVGSVLKGKVLILDDVISAGTSVRESSAIINAHNAIPVGVVIALDRQEHAAIGGLPITSIVKFTDLVAYLAELPERSADLIQMKAYQSQYATFTPPPGHSS